MAVYLRTNLASISAQNYLSNATSILATIYQRLASGSRINSAKDDAAGLQISNRMTTQINGLNQANRNANDGIALAQTVEGAMDEMTSMYQAIRTLAVQSASGTYTSTDREAMQQDVSSYSAEITRISEKTTYNGQTVLSGKSDSDTLLDAQGKISIQVGSDSYDYISVDLSEGYSVIQTAKSAISSYYEETTITALSDEEFAAMFGDDGTVYYGSDGTAYGIATDTDGNIYINYTTLTSLDLTSGNTESGATLDSSNSELISAAETAREALQGLNDTNSLTINITVDEAYALLNGADNDSNSNNTLNGALFGLNVTDTSNGEATEAELDVSTVANAQGCLTWVDNYQAVVDSKRAELGAVQNRLESVISNQSNIATNTADARSRITDTDYAEATSELASASIVQQAATSMLTQANSAQSSIVMKLLEGI